MFTDYSIALCTEAQFKSDLRCCKVGLVYTTFDENRSCCDVNEGQGSVTNS